MNMAEGLQTEMTLGQAISKLEEVSWKINAQVFGERSEETKNPVAQAGDVITRAKNRIIEVTGRLAGVLGRLQTLGN